MTNLDKQKILLAGKIAAQVREHARGFIKKGMSLLEIAERIESKMFELGGKPAFQTCLSIDDEAAHLVDVDAADHVAGSVNRRVRAGLGASAQVDTDHDRPAVARGGPLVLHAEAHRRRY